VAPRTIQRPVFHEGQILAAADLQRSLAYSRDQDARHERYLHTWGIADGLEVTKQEPGGDFVLQPGFAVDSSGAPIVVADPIVLDVEQLLEEALVNRNKDHERQFPLFIARIETETANDQPLSNCANAAPTRKSEGVVVQFRPVATGWDENQDPVRTEDGPLDGNSRVVLVGFVTWEKVPSNQLGKITAFRRDHKQDGIRPRFAGVQADEVAARSGELVLRSKPLGEPDSRDAPMVVLGDHENENALVLGLDNGEGQVNEILSVDAKGTLRAKGNIEAAGSLKGQISSGTVFVQSGVASDGMVLPLPAEIKREDVEDGSVTLHITVTPKTNWSSANRPRPQDGWGPFTFECHVDDDRRVHCTTRWLKLSGTKDITQIDFPDAVDYLVVASAPAKGENS
jgi:hypothetical protein